MPRLVNRIEKYWRIWDVCVILDNKLSKNKKSLRQRQNWIAMERHQAPPLHSRTCSEWKHTMPVCPKQSCHSHRQWKRHRYRQSTRDGKQTPEKNTRRDKYDERFDVIMRSGIVRTNRNMWRFSKHKRRSKNLYWRLDKLCVEMMTVSKSGNK